MSGCFSHAGILYSCVDDNWMEFSNDLSWVEVYFLISLVCLFFFVVLYRNVGGRMLL